MWKTLCDPHQCTAAILKLCSNVRVIRTVSQNRKGHANKVLVTANLDVPLVWTSAWEGHSVLVSQTLLQKICARDRESRVTRVRHVSSHVSHHVIQLAWKS